MSNRPRFLQALAKVHTSLPDLSLQSFTTIANSNNTVFRFTAAHGKAAKDLNLGDYCTMVTSSFGDQFSLIPGSMDLVASTNLKDIVSGIVVSNTVSKPVTREDLKNEYRLVSANVFMDEEDKIWKMVGDGNERRLVQAIKEDLDKILESRMARRSSEIVASSLINYVGLSPERGDYVMYYSVNSMDYNYGYGVVAGNSILVAPRNNHTVETIVSEQIIACVESESLPEEKQDKRVMAMMFNNPKATTQNFSSDMGSEYLNYMRQIYADTPFYEKLEELIGLRRNVANLNAPLNTSES
jgi:hypothetical protein